MSRAPRRGGVVLRRLGMAGLVAAVGLALVPPATSVGAAEPGARLAAAPAPGGYSATRTVGREVLNADGSADPTLSWSSDMTVTADQTRDLRGRERVRVAWSGAHPSNGRASNPYGEKGLLQEYPVVVLQCRGVDDPAAPAAKRLRPETCWTSSVEQRSQRTRSRGEATWRVDRYADEADRRPVSGLDPFPSAECPGQDSAIANTHLTPFVSAEGKTFSACAAEKMPPEAAIDSAFPPAELAAFTDLDGRGSVQFEVRSDIENQSLGCNDKTDCAIVVVPIVGISCDKPTAAATVTDRACRKKGRLAPGSSNGADEGVDQAVAPSLWWSASNWRNRFTVPITFGLPASVCDVLDNRAPTSFFGSELMSQAALQWAPAYCLRKDRFNLQLSQMPDEVGFTNMLEGEGPAAFVSTRYDAPPDQPVAYAPTAVSGFGIGYTIDRKDNAGEYDRLRLTPRLIAKLLTQSYLGSDLGRGHPGIEGNPLAIMADREFQELNPDISDNIQEAGATLLSLSVSSDVMRQLTSYIAQDADAAAFLAGKPDPWGMKVNPSYRDIALPVDEWPLLDTYVPQTNSECRKQNPSVYFSQLAAPVSTLRIISDVLIDGWPNVQTRCDFDTASGTYKLGRKDRQSYGTRFVLGIVSLGDAERFGLRVAALKTKGDTYVAPTAASMGKAVQLLTQDGRLGPFSAPQTKVVAAGDAYPGTMPVFTTARTSGLPAPAARNVASFIRIATTEGQRVGRGNGQLPDGYLPIVDRGATRPLWRAARAAADAIEAQKGAATTGTKGATPAAGSGAGAAGSTAADVVPDAAAAAADPAAGVAPAGTTDADTVPTAATAAPGSALGGVLLPGLLLIGMLAGASAVVSRLVGARRGAL